jgi:non-homologous end joining protein Ku
VALESTRTIEIDEFVDRSEIDPRYLIRPYYLSPDGKVGHDAFAVIRETIREMNKVAIGRVVLTNREHIIALEPLDRGLMGTLLRYPYEVRSEEEYFDEIQDVKVTKDMLDLAKHIVNQKAGRFEPDKFEDQYETAPRRPHQPEARRQANHAKGAAARRERSRSDGGPAAERGRRCVGDQGSEKAGQEGTQSGGRPEGDADADRRKEAGQGVGGEEAGGQTTEVGLGRSLVPFP